MSVSTHAPRAGSDTLDMTVSSETTVFQPTPPARGATDLPRRAGPLRKRFNPRPPRGERLGVNVERHRQDLVSTHAPRAGSDA